MRYAARTAGQGAWYRELLSWRVIVLAVVALGLAAWNFAPRGTGAVTSGAPPASGASVALAPAAITGNCADAVTVAGRAASLAAVVGRASSRLDLLPTARCAQSGAALQRYRAHVRTVTLLIGFTTGAWAAANAGSKRELPPALAQALRVVYPRAVITVRVQAGDVQAARVTRAAPHVAGR